MQKIRVKMVRNNLLQIPKYELPESYKIRLFQTGDEHNWARIETSVGEFVNEKAGREHFNQEFGKQLDDMEKRCLFIENPEGEAIATTTAWHSDLSGSRELIGRIHWVAVMPAYQGKGLAKPLLSAALEVLANYHTSAYLRTQTTSYQAVNMYVNYGFKPYHYQASCEKAWEILSGKLNV